MLLQCGQEWNAFDCEITFGPILTQYNIIYPYTDNYKHPHVLFFRNNQTKF